jgi:negative regulator of genetic competence, sporulation and motility
MKIEKLSVNKIKVTVGQRDLSIWDLSVQALNPESPFLREFIMSLVRHAESEMGFAEDCRRWVVEIMPQENEFVFVMTRVDISCAAAEERECLRRKMQSRNYRVVKKAVSRRQPFESIYRFDSFEDFVTMFNIAGGAAEFRRSKLYKMGGFYYLKTRLTVHIDGVQSNSALTQALLSEFAALPGEGLLAARLAEYGSLVAEGSDFEEIERTFA